MTGGFAEWWYRLRDLVIPDECAACGVAPPLARPLCGPCALTVGDLSGFRRTGVLSRPVWAAGDYVGVLREAILAFKVGGRRDLTPVLARALSVPLMTALAGPPPCRDGVPVMLLPIPSTRRARRQRGFDHVRSLAVALSRGMPDGQWCSPLAAAPRPDSAGLSITARHRAAAASIRPIRGRMRWLRRLQRERPQMRMFLLDDIVTSGATLRAADAMFRRAGIGVTGAIVIASVNQRPM